ncbi:MAG: amidohydrolase family protein [Desulfurococcales archaeon]|nr:amidohydrolase family protein [Desulfurococcales archaeon]
MTSHKYNDYNSSYSIKAGLVLLGEHLILKENRCLWIREGVVESIESFASCNSDSLGGEHIVVLPQPANAHIHSADYAFPEYGIELDLDSLVSYPRGIKHQLLNKIGVEDLENSILSSYRTAWSYGLGLIADFREGGGRGCSIAKRALLKAPEGMEVVILGRPGPDWPKDCDGLGVSSPLDYSHDELSHIINGWDIKMTHVAENMKSRIAGDLEIALEYGFTGLVHGVYLDRSDLELIASNEAGLVLCLRSNLWHGLGVPPLSDIMDLGILFALGSDNMAWMTPDVWEEARALLYLSRLRSKSIKLIDSVLQALFINGYRILRRTPRTISEGGRAYMLLFADYDGVMSRAVNKRAAIIKRIGKGNILARIDEGIASFL